jgi:hypothetical protein
MMWRGKRSISAGRAIGWMSRLVMSGEEITPDHIEIAIVNMTVIFSDQPFAIRFVPRRNFVPSHGWFFMMS